MGSAYKLSWLVFALSIIVGVASFLGAPGDLAMPDAITGEMRARTSILTYIFYPAIIALVLGLTTAATYGNPHMRDTRFRNIVLIGTVSVLFICQLRYDTQAFDWSFAPRHFLQFVGFFGGLLLIVAGNYLPKAVRQDSLEVPKPWSYVFSIPWTLPFGYLFGVRTWWTLASENVWNRTHRLTGRLWIVSGLCLAAAAWFADIGAYRAVILMSLILNIVIPILYSFIIRQAPESA